MTNNNFDVAINAGYYIPFLIFGGIFLFVACIFLKAWLQSRKIIKQGQTTIATVKANHVRRESSAVGERGSRMMHPVFEWTVNDQVYEKESRGGQNPPKYHVGQKVAIYYDPMNPKEMTLRGSEKVMRILMIVFGTVGGILLLIGLLVWL